MSQMVGYADAGYLSDPHRGRSQTGYVFLVAGTAVSWRSQKQTLAASSSNHAEIIALTTSVVEKPTVLYEDNRACLAQELNNKEIQLAYVPSEKNLADVLTKSLDRNRHRELIQGLGMRRVADLHPTTE